MRAFKQFPKIQVAASTLSRDAQKRLAWIDFYLSHDRNISLTCRHFGISRDTFYRWKRRFNPRVLQSLEFDTKTRRPKRVREMQVAKDLVDRIYAIRKDDPEKSKYEIQAELQMEGRAIGQSAIQKIINRHTELRNVQHKKRRRNHRHRKIARLKAEPAMRDNGVGSLIQVDTQYFSLLGNTYYLFAAIDCTSRFGFVYAYRSISSASGRDFIKRVKAYFPFSIQAINTDNGSEYLLNFHKEIEAWGIPHFFTDPHCPKQNGRVERFHQTVAYEYLHYQHLYPDLEIVRHHCMLFNTKYNTKRFHRSLGYKTPHQVVIEYQEQKGALYGI